MGNISVQKKWYHWPNSTIIHFEIQILFNVFVFIFLHNIICMSVYNTLHGLEIKNDGEADNITVKDHSLNIQSLFISIIAKTCFSRLTRFITLCTSIIFSLPMKNSS